MNWFCGLRRWIRVYICFLLPLLAIGIALYFREYITVTVFSCLTAFVTLPLFIYSEEIRKERRDEEFEEFFENTVVHNQKTEIGLMRSIVPAASSNNATQEESTIEPTIKTPIDDITVGTFPIQTILSGVMQKGRKEEIANSAVGDLLTISHSGKADHPNTFYVSNDCTGETLGLLPLSLGMHLTKIYGKSAQFVGEIVNIQTGNQIVCEIKINSVKE